MKLNLNPVHVLQNLLRAAFAEDKELLFHLTDLPRVAERIPYNFDEAWVYVQGNLAEATRTGYRYGGYHWKRGDTELVGWVGTDNKVYQLPDPDFVLMITAAYREAVAEMIRRAA